MLDDIQIAILAANIKNANLIGANLEEEAKKILEVINKLRDKQTLETMVFLKRK